MEVGENCNGFVVGLPKTMGKYDSFWVIVERLTKSSHFIPVKVTYNADCSIAWSSTVYYIR